jgi:aspartate racemase
MSSPTPTDGGALRAQIAIPGIIGGLGPLAHIALERRLIAESARRGATGDRGHPVWILINATDIPDRTASLADGSDGCVRSLVHYGRVLEAAGADFLVVACNTAHAFHRRVQAQLAIPWLHLIDHTAAEIARRHPGIARVGVLATDGTLRTSLYQRSLLDVGIATIAPTPGSDLQIEIMDAIYAPGWGIKASGAEISAQAQAAVWRAVHWLQQRGAELVVAGCTELSAALETLTLVTSLPLPWLDPLEIAAHLTLDLAFGAGAPARAPAAPVAPTALRSAPRKASR